MKKNILYFPTYDPFTCKPKILYILRAFKENTLVEGTEENIARQHSLLPDIETLSPANEFRIRRSKEPRFVALNPPEKSAMATCWIYPRLKPAEFTRQKNPPFQLVACLPEIPPSPLKIPRQDMARHSPPPPAAPPTEQGGGGREPARPTHAS
jgi:hypothetical protein